MGRNQVQKREKKEEDKARWRRKKGKKKMSISPEEQLTVTRSHRADDSHTGIPTRPRMQSRRGCGFAPFGGKAAHLLRAFYWFLKDKWDHGVESVVLFHGDPGPMDPWAVAFTVMKSVCKPYAVTLTFYHSWDVWRGGRHPVSPERAAVVCSQTQVQGSCFLPRFEMEGRF